MHYTVAVFHRDDQEIDELLAPYNEGISVAPYVEFTKQEAIAYYRKHNSKEAEGLTDEECFQNMVSFYGYDEDRVDEDGNLYTTYNPDSKWDWYSIGGRWGGSLRLKSSGEEDWGCDSAKISDVDFTAGDESYQKCLDWWNEDVVGENIMSFYTREYLDQVKAAYKDGEEYASLNSMFHTYAYVTPNGVWHAPGEMGWFASSETPAEFRQWLIDYKEFLENADPDLYITMVDCHI